MADGANDAPWPEMEKLPVLVCHKVKCFLNTAEAAATTIQRAIRRTPNDNTASLKNLSEWQMLSRARLEDQLCGPTSCVAVSEKLDGTNLGLRDDGCLVGRRISVPSSSDTYHKVDVRPVRAYNIAAFSARIRAASPSLASAHAEAARVVLYGEAMCNRTLYKYADAGHAGHWRVFGAVIDFTLSTDGAPLVDVCECVKELAQAGFVLSTGERDDGSAPRRVTILRCPTFDAAVVCGGPVAPAVALAPSRPMVGGATGGADDRAVADGTVASVVDMIGANSDWMRSVGGGEGIVVVMREHGSGPRGGGGIGVQTKWKQAQEAAPTSEKALRETVGRLHELRVADKGAGWFDARIAAAVETLLAVQMAPPPILTAKPQTPHCSKGESSAMLALVAAAERAVCSAATKFDAPAAHFERSSKKGREEYTTLLQGEVMSDRDFLSEVALAQAATDSAKKTRKDLEQLAMRAVRAFVGKAYGEWMKSKAGG